MKIDNIHSLGYDGYEFRVGEPHNYSRGLVKSPEDKVTKIIEERGKYIVCLDNGHELRMPADAFIAEFVPEHSNEYYEKEEFGF